MIIAERGGVVGGCYVYAIAHREPATTFAGRIPRRVQPVVSPVLDAHAPEQVFRDPRNRSEQDHCGFIETMITLLHEGEGRLLSVRQSGRPLVTACASMVPCYQNVG